MNSLSHDMAAIDNEDYMFECPICFGQIDDTWKMLSCQHTFCSSCLEKLYEAKRNPQCPTCRRGMTVSIECLQTPQILFNLYAEYKADREKRIDQKPEMVKSDDQEEEIVSELTTMMQSCKFQSDSNQAEPIPSEQSVDKLRRDKHTPISESFCPIVVKHIAPLDDVSDCINDNPTSVLNVPMNLSNYLSKDHQKFMMDTLIIQTMNENVLNSLEKSKILEYLEIINDHLNALELYRRDKIVELANEHSGENREAVAHILGLNNLDENRVGADEDNCENEENDLRLALEISRQMTNDDELLDITLKKSEILDPIDSLQIQFGNIKEKLEIRKIIIESMELIY